MARKSQIGASRSRRVKVGLHSSPRSVQPTVNNRCPDGENGRGDIRYHLRGHFLDASKPTEETSTEPSIVSEENQNTKVCTCEDKTPKVIIPNSYTVFPRPSLSEAIKGKCCDCSANYADGRNDYRCSRSCPFYHRMPYRKDVPSFRWLFGKYSKRHSNRAEKVGMSKEEYIEACVQRYLTKIDNPKLLKISLPECVRAKCFDCSADYHADGGEKGRVECELSDCPIYYWTPYRELNPNYDWMFELVYTRRHMIAISALGITRNQYIERVLVNGERL